MIYIVGPNEDQDFSKGFGSTFEEALERWSSYTDIINGYSEFHIHNPTVIEGKELSASISVKTVYSVDLKDVAHTTS